MISFEYSITHTRLRNNTCNTVQRNELKLFKIDFKLKIPCVSYANENVLLIIMDE